MDADAVIGNAGNEVGKMTVLTIVGEALVQKMLAINLQQLGLLVTWEDNILSACSALDSVTPDLIIFDTATAPGYRNVLADRLYGQAETSGIPVITLLERRSGEPFGLRNGDALHKPVAPRLLVDLVRNVLKHDTQALHSANCCAGGISLNPLTHRVTHAGQEIALRPKEFRLLAFLMRHADRVFDRNQLLDEVWGGDVFVDERSVDVIIRRLRAALEIHDLADRIETVRGAGYRFRDPGR